MKTCSKCHKIKDIGCFAKQAKAADGLFTWCKDCHKKYKREKYNENLQKNRSYTNDKRADRINWFQELKSNLSCIDCAQIYEPYCMDYDHLPNQIKIKNVSKMVIDNTPKEIILEEIKKCELVCLLCHNKRTYTRFNEILGKDRKYKPHQQRNINIIDDFKNKPCAICNIQYELYNMQIDHIDPGTKLYDVCQLKSRKEKILQDELAKCQVLCALCHRRKSIIEQQNDKYSASRVSPLKRKKLFYDLINNWKECGRCHETKDSSKFRPNKKTKSGLDTYCKGCFNDYRRERRKVQAGDVVNE